MLVRPKIDERFASRLSLVLALIPAGVVVAIMTAVVLLVQHAKYGLRDSGLVMLSGLVGFFFTVANTMYGIHVAFALRSWRVLLRHFGLAVIPWMTFVLFVVMLKLMGHEVSFK